MARTRSIEIIEDQSGPVDDGPQEADMRVLTALSALALATGLFWGTMLTRPPTSEARPGLGIDTREITLRAHLDEADPCDAN
ncbi:hypothetical protein SAMN02799631_02381 [Methylobacterium sp. 174MFSha1.1]|uniref:hypothetical protein n=1 Tax=Methylobacterium sp. 174MFSha1.1 TaxID=1502749 RepID=UPI0008E31A44|nr:hypothetical protein [Methylobacterium sp. 174MFSha1.1]SFU79781.1 hypothetical protein SAMN02799631_02381 [Methylobacterium sp. 174MFSha1.1]